MVRNEGEVAIPAGVLKVQNFQDALIFLKEDVCLFKLLLLDEVMSNIRKLRQKNRYLILIDFDFFVVKLVKGVILILLSRLLLVLVHFFHLSFVQNCPSIRNAKLGWLCWNCSLLLHDFCQRVRLQLRCVCCFYLWGFLLGWIHFVIQRRNVYLVVHLEVAQSAVNMDHFLVDEAGGLFLFVHGSCDEVERLGVGILG